MRTSFSPDRAEDQSGPRGRPRSRLILSAHDFQGKFPDIRRLHRDIQQAFPDAVPKLVYTANHINDCFDAFDLLHETQGDRIVLCMGQAGLISRVLARKLGSFVTFASLDEQAATAPGQLTVGTSRRVSTVTTASMRRRSFSA